MARWGGIRVAPPVTLTPEERAQLQVWARGRSAPHNVVQRASIVLRAAEGYTNKEIVAELGCHPDTVTLWRRRFLSHRLQGIEHDAPRPTPRLPLPKDLVDRILRTTLQEKPRGATHWSTRSLARVIGVNHVAIHRVWRAHHLAPHKVRTFKLSNDKKFAEKVRDIVGLYMNPPDKAAIFCFDEKTQIQALDRTQTRLPIAPNLPETRTHDYKRNGTINLFAALNLLDGKVITAFQKRNRHREFLFFLRRVDERVPRELAVHVVLDNGSSHKGDTIRRWMKRHPRFHLHYTPTSSSWINLVERWFLDLTEKRIRRGTFQSVPELILAIQEYAATYNEAPRPFVWTAKCEDILRKVERYRERLVAANAAA